MSFDAIVLGLGSGGEQIAEKLARRGWRVAGIEAGYVGGECPFLACIPSKALLASAARARRSGGDAAARRSQWAQAVADRREATDDLDDSAAADALREAGVELLRGRGEIRSAHEVVFRPADGPERALTWSRALVVGAGSTPTTPPVDGLDDVPTWTSDQALTSDELPERLLVLGGGPIGCELSQVYASFGVEVTLVETSPSLLPGEDAWVGDALAEHLRRSGVDVRTGSTAVQARAAAGGAVILLEAAADTGSDEDTADSRSEVQVDRVLVATGRTPSGESAGVGRLGVDLDAGPVPGAVPVDDRCRVLDAQSRVVDGVSAVGDVTGIAPYTHTANHHARVVLARLPSEPSGADVESPVHHRRTRHEGIPRAVYTEPAVYSVGLSVAAAEKQGVDFRTAYFDVAESARGFLGGFDGPGGVRLVVDAHDGRLLGAACIGPEADSWGGELALAVTAGLHVDLLAEHVRAFPTWSEVITPAALELADPPTGD